MRREIKATIVGVEKHADGEGYLVTIADRICLGADIVGIDLETAQALPIGSEVLLTIGTGGRTLCDVLLEQVQDEVDALRAKVAELEAELAAMTPNDS